MRILICGDRNWTDRERIAMFLAPLGSDTIIIEGGARGADTIAKEEAELRSFQVMEFPAQWNKYGKSAGPIRNKQMLDEGKPDLVVAFHNDIKNSKGTKNMIKQAKKAGIKVILVEK